MKALGLDFIRRVIATSAVMAALALLFLSVYYDWRFALGVFVGTAWNIANFHFLSELTVAVLTPGERNVKRVAVWALLKFPVLYAAGYLVLKYGEFPVLSFLIGFSLLFVVAILKVLGRLLNEWLAGVRPPHNVNPTVR